MAIYPYVGVIEMLCEYIYKYTIFIACLVSGWQLQSGWLNHLPIGFRLR